MKNLFTLILLYIFLFSVIYYGNDITTGIRNGIDISLNLVIPSMFLFIIISNFILSSGLKKIVSLPFNFITKKLFKINSNDTAIFILSLIGGYPIGARLLATSVKAKTISPKKASIMLAYCVNCGPAFLISGIGGLILGNPQLGVFMYTAQIIACIIIGIISSFFISKLNEPEPTNCKTENIPISTLIITSVSEAIKPMSIICGFIVFFSAVMPVLINIFGNYVDIVIFNGILEVTAGCNLVTSLPPLQAILYASAFVALGGICVILQILAMLSNTGITMKYFLLFKPLYITTNVVITYILLQIYPETMVVFENFCITNCYSNGQEITQNIFSVSPIATFFMIILAILLLFFSTKYDIIERDFIN